VNVEPDGLMCNAFNPCFEVHFDVMNANDSFRTECVDTPSPMNEPPPTEPPVESNVIGGPLFVVLAPSVTPVLGFTFGLLPFHAIVPGGAVPPPWPVNTAVQSFVVSIVTTTDFPFDTRAPSPVPEQLSNFDVSVTVSLVAVPPLINGGLYVIFALTLQCNVPVPLTGGPDFAPAGTTIISSTAAVTATIAVTRLPPLTGSSSARQPSDAGSARRYDRT
jgi:hypothetical protein